MGFPHPTVDLPGHWPALASEVDRVRLRTPLSDDLADLLRGREHTHGRTRDDNHHDHVSPSHVCATAWVLSHDRRYTVLVHHRTLGWCTPGGHVERHETSHAAALRELTEETGLTAFDVTGILDGPAVVHSVDTVSGGTPHRHVNIGWLFTASMEAPLSSVEQARWHAVEDVMAGRLADDSAPDLVDVLSRLIEI